MRTPVDAYCEWLLRLSADEICAALRALGAEEVFIKPLAANQDNSKNQIYVGSDLSQLARFNPGEPVPRTGTSRKRGGQNGKIFHAPVDWRWLAPGFRPVVAPEAKFIVHPQYPEVRLSGFLRQCEDPPAWLLDRDSVGGEAGRCLIAAPVGEAVFALILPPCALAAPYFSGIFEKSERIGPFGVGQLGPVRAEVDSRKALLARIAEIAALGWMDPMRLRRGERIPYVGQNSLGYTLEALFDVEPNGRAEPDFQGWELKAHRVNNLALPRFSGALTLLTPEPDGGVYCEEGIVRFVQRWGRGDSLRMDFAGVHVVGRSPNVRTNLRLELAGYRSPDDFDATGDVRLVDGSGEVAASWSFGKILGHWARKHARTAYIPAARSEDGVALAFARQCWLGEGARFKHFLGALAQGSVRYDPGIHIDRNVSGSWSSKRRSQFRALGRDLPVLYDSFTCETV